MSKTLLRGLELIEAVGVHGPLTVTEIARRMGAEVSFVSRTVSALEPDGWLARVQGRVVVGPRCALLGASSPANDAIRRAEPIVRAVAGIVGVNTIASALVGREAMVLAAATVRDGLGPLTGGTLSHTPLHLMADGRAIAAQLSSETLDDVLPDEPYPTAQELLEGEAFGDAVTRFMDALPGSQTPLHTLVSGRAELDAAVAQILAEGYSYDTGQVHPGIYCIARSWPAANLPSAIACIGTRDEVFGQRELIESCLAAATAPGATPQDIARAAA
jgi:DNA-binding IclR family transcriptional regulator